VDTRATAPLASREAMAISARDVVVSRGGSVALEIDSLDVGAGQVVALVGPNGSGKSTLLHAVAGLLPHRGSLLVGGRPAGRSRSSIAYVLQSQAIHPTMPVTVEEAVAVALPRGRAGGGRGARRSAVRDALELVELADVAGRRLRELSGGQRQRVLLAQGLAQPHDVLLLDEPTAGLDLASMRVVQQVVADQRAGGRTVVVATHDLGEAAEADLVVIVAGRLIAAGPPGEVLTADVLQRAYHGRLVTIDGTLVLDEGAHHHHDHGTPAA
jgi:ABC-type Mn2+/Zn2+ transport system ATPase subunit